MKIDVAVDGIGNNSAATRLARLRDRVLREFANGLRSERRWA